MLDGGRNILYLLALVAPHQEHADENPMLLREFDGTADLLDADAALHRVQYPLAAALGADPDPIATQVPQYLDGFLRLKAVGASDGLERQAKSASVESCLVPLQPRVADGEHIVRIPELVRVIPLHDPGHFRRDILRTTAPVGVTIHGVRAPGASIRAAARRDEIDAARSVMRSPRVEILLMIDGSAVRQRQRVKVVDLRALRRVHRFAG